MTDIERVREIDRLRSKAHNAKNELSSFLGCCGTVTFGEMIGFAEREIEKLLLKIGKAAVAEETK